MTRIRKKGVAFVDTSKGILLVSDRSRRFTLPGGAVSGRESRKGASIRELREETGLKTKSAKYFLSYKGHLKMEKQIISSWMDMHSEADFLEKL